MQITTHGQIFTILDDSNPTFLLIRLLVSFQSFLQIPQGQMEKSLNDHLEINTKKVHFNNESRGITNKT